MKPPIQKEKAKKQEKIIYIVLIVAAVIYSLLVKLHMNAMMAEDPRLGTMEALVAACSNVFTKPGEIWPPNFSGMGTMLLLYIIGGMFGLMMAIDQSLRKHDNSETVNGEAHFMNQKEMDEYNMKRTDPFGKATHDGPKNMLLSQEISLAMEGHKTRRNCNVLVIGGSGAGKSRFFAGPNVLQYNANFVITDPSGEFLNDYGKALEDNGYAVKVFNLTDVYRGNRYNPFHYIREEKDVFTLVETLIKNTTPPDGKGGDPFWENSEKLLLTALILYLWHNYEPEEQTFTNVVKLVNMAEVDENDASAESPLDLLFKDLEREDKDNLAVQQYKTFKLGAGKTLKSILISVGVRLKSFTLSDIQYLTEKDEFEFERFADTKQALFVIIPTADTTFNFLVSLLYSQLFATLYTYVETQVNFGWKAYIDDLNTIKVEQAKNKKESVEAEKRIRQFVEDVNAGVVVKHDKEKKLYRVYVKKTGEMIAWRGTKEMVTAYVKKLKNIKVDKCPRKCPNHVRLILDEFANIGQIPDFDQKLATIRKYEISCSIILQAISQLKDMYKDKWNTIAGNCDTKLFLGCDDQDTIEWLLKMLGKKTTTVENTSWQANGSGSTSLNKSSLELMTIDQVTMMADDECLVRIRGERPYYGKKYELTKHPNYDYSKKTAGEFLIPLPPEVADRATGPLRLRKAEKEDNIKKLAVMTESAVSAIHEEGSGEKKMLEDRSSSAPGYAPDDGEDVRENVFRESKKESNKKRKSDSADARQQLKEMQDMENTNSESMIEAGILDALQLKEGSSDEEIKESIESVIELTSPPEDAFVYASTN